MQAIVEAIETKKLPAEAALVVSNNSSAKALTFAREHAISSAHISQLTEGGPEAADEKLRQELVHAQVNLVILSGYMRPIGPLVLKAFEGRILNVHPAVDMRRFAGRGMYGDHVHQTVLDAKEPVTGVTIHQVDEDYDHGPVVAQEEVPIAPNDTVETLRKRVQDEEKILFVKVLQKIATT